MGYYLCPRCGSRDSYEGTEHVLHEKQGRQVTVDNGHGMAMSRVEGGGTERLELTVIKCRDCGETLGDKDFRLTEEEIQAAEEEERLKEELREKEFQESNQRLDKYLGIFNKFIVLPLFIILISWIIYDSLTKN